MTDQKIIFLSFNELNFDYLKRYIEIDKLKNFKKIINELKITTSEQEYQKVHIPTAIHIPLQDIANRSQEIKGILKGKDSEFYLVCAVGGRSAQAAEQLAAMGFAKPINVMGGTNGWVAMGFPTEKGNQK